MYTLCRYPGKGLGLAATRHIPKGTRIISEPILISVPKRMYSTEERLKLIDQQLDAMTDGQRETLRHISVYEWFRLPGIERDNSPRHFLPVKELSTMDVIFGDANRINHDCDSNAQHHWNDDIKRLTVHALRDIQPGEEITTSYGSFLNSQNVRRAMFEAMFCFHCSCRLCSLPDNQMQERDRKVAQFTHAERSLQKGSDKHPAFIKLGLFRVQARVYKELGREDIRLAQVYEDAASITITHGALAKGRVFAQKAASIWTTVAGSDSPQAIKYAALAEQPRRHERYGFSMMWEEAVGATPQGLGPDDFENWLWNNETPKGLARPTSLSSQSHFSGFADLPSNNGVGTSGSSKKRHWCFLGEIAEDSLFHPLLLDTKDIHGEKVELHFYTKDKGLEFMPNHSQKRHTIVVLDATKYTFKFGPPGIRLEDPRKIQIFPLSLAKTLALNDLVRRLSTRQHSNTRTCHGCGKDAPASSMKRCSMCLSFWYCNKECQTAGWTKKGHKIDCGYLRHPDLRGLFFINWDEVQDPVRFPLQVADDFC